MPNAVFKNGAVSWGRPINWASPVNRGLTNWFLTRPNMFGSTFFDLCGSNTATFTNYFVGIWQGGVTRPGGFGHIALDGATHGAAASPGTLTKISRDGWTIAGWFKSNTSSATQFAIGMGDGGVADAGIVPARSGVIQVYQSDVYRSSGVSITTTDWFHIAMTRTSSSVGTMSVNGVSYSANPTTTSSDNMTFWIGGLQGALFFDGSVDDVRIYNRVLNDVDLAALYNASRMGYQNELNRISRPIAIPAAAASAFKPSWARYANQVISIPGAA